MRDPIRYDLFGDRGLALLETIPLVGYDFTGATMRAQVRLTPDAIGLVSTLTVTMPYAGTATVAAHIAAGRIPVAIYDHVNPATGVNYVGTDNIAVSVIQLALSAAHMAADIPAADETGDTVTLAWDLLIDRDGAGSASEDKWFYGAFVVRGTVTQ